MTAFFCFFFKWDVAWLSLKTCIELFFFPLLFSGYFRSADLRVISIAFCGCNQSSSTFLCSLRIVVSMRQCYRQCWQVLFLPLFLIHLFCQRHLWDARPYAWILVFLFFGPFAWVLLWFTSGIALSILRGGQPRYLSLWQASYNRVLSRVFFWFSWDTLFKFFLSFQLVWWCQLPIFPRFFRFGLVFFV